MTHIAEAPALNPARRYDVVIVGGGIGGMTAALRCAELGASVVVLEKGREQHYPCNTRYSGGIFHICLHPLTQPAGQLAELITNTTDGTVEPEIVDALAGTAARSMDWLREQGVRFIKASMQFQALAVAPPRPGQTGVLWEKGRGGDALLTTLEKRLNKLGHRVERGVRATHIRMQDNACCGVRAEAENGTVEFDARAVVLADGGFQSDTELAATHISPYAGKIVQRNAGTGTGDGLRMAVAAGAAAKGLGYGFYGHLLSLDVLKNDALWPYPTIDDVACTGILVDRQGHRFVDEGLGGVHAANVLARLEGLRDATAIFDQTIWDACRTTVWASTNPWLEKTGGTVVRASSVDELARLIDVDSTTLSQTISDYNRAVAANSFAGLTPARSMPVRAARAARPIMDPPFGAIKVVPGMTHTFGGVSIDMDGRVRTPAGTAIPGLYAVGSTTGGVEGGPLYGYVGGLSKAAIFGIRAAEHIMTDARPATGLTGPQHQIQVLS